MAAATAAGTVFTGKCVACKTPYSYVETAPGAHNGYRPNQPYCACRANIECTDWRHGDEPHTHLATAIKFTAVKAVASERECSAACTGGVSPYCACKCQGVNHGADNRVPARDA